MMNRRFQNSQKAVWALTRLTLLESWRGRSGRFLLFSLIAVQLIASFAVQMAVTESNDLHLTTCAFLYRLTLVFALGASMITNVVREHETGFVYVLLAHPVSRMQYVLGRIFGYAIVAAVAALLVTAVMAFWVPLAQWGGLAAWGLSLWLELVVVGAAALFFALGMRNMVGAMAIWLAFYVLARVLDVARAMAMSPIGQDPNGLGVQLGQWVFTALGWLIPPLGGYTRSEWLLGQGLPSAELCVILAVWALVYGVFCTVAAAIDFYRHEV